MTSLDNTFKIKIKLLLKYLIFISHRVQKYSSKKIKKNSPILPFLSFSSLLTPTHNHRVCLAEGFERDGFGRFNLYFDKILKWGLLFAIYYKRIVQEWQELTCGGILYKFIV